jgi:hypothetical protein
LQSFYCTLASESDGPEAVSGAVRTLKSVICAVEKQLGTLPFNTTATVQPITSLTFDITCASQHFLDDMGASGASSVTIPVTSASITTQANPNFTEISSNTHFSHGFRFNGEMNGNNTTFIILAKFDPSFSGDPLESGDFEFMTMGTGMQGTAVETTAGKIVRSSSTSGRMWYEFKANRQKATANDAICPNDSSSCGWARHIRIATDITFASGDIADVSNFTGVISDSNDDTGAGGSGKQSRLITATGALTTGLTGKVWTSSGSALDDMDGTTTVADLTAETTTCVIGAGTNITTTCGGIGVPAYLDPATTAIQEFFLPPNNTTSFVLATTKGGVGFTGAATLANDQYANP